MAKSTIEMFLRPRKSVSTHTQQVIHILHVIHSFGIGGMENGLANLINNSNSDRFSHSICCMTHSGKMHNRLNKHIPIYELNKTARFPLTSIVKLAMLMRKCRPHIVHTRGAGAIDGIIAAKLARIPIIIHGEHGYKIDDVYGKRMRTLAIRRFCSLFVSHYVAVSEDIKAWLCISVCVSPHRISQISNGIDTNRFKPACGVNRDNNTGQYSKTRLVIGSVGRLDPIKRFHLLLNAFSQLDHENFDLSLIIAGDGPERTALEVMRSENRYGSKIMLLGEIIDVANLYKEMDLFVLPSMNEGMSNTILEAMATGIPIIASSSGGNKEVVRNGETGILFPADENDSAKLAAAIKFYLDNPHIRTLHGRNARSVIETKHALNNMVERYENLYLRFFKTI